LVTGRSGRQRLRAKSLARVALGALTVGLAVLAAGCSASRTDVIRIGVIADCEGSFSFGYESALAGAELPLIDRGASLRGARPSDGIDGASVAGKHVELLFGCDRSNRATAIAELRRLVEQEGADAIVGLNISHEGLVMRDYAKHQPAVTFVFAGIDQSTTLKNPSPNVFRFRPGPAQWEAGVGAYAYRELGWRSAVTISEDDFFGWTSVAGFVAEFCSLGGNVTQRRWFPADPNFKFAPLVSTIPANGIDGAFLTDGLFDTHSFIAAWSAWHHHLARSLVTEDNLLVENPNDPRLLGVVASNTTPWADTPQWRRYTAGFRRAFPKLQAPDSVDYFDATEALLEALGQVHGDLSHGERRLMATLARVRLDSPEGRRRLDAKHQEVGSIYLGRMESAPGKLVVRQIRVVPNVEQTFGGYFSGTTPAPSRTQPRCRHGHPPPWTRYRVRSTR
jgi:branched-chain amino acid transport system substrate-binding protein